MLYPHRLSICPHNLKTPELQLSCWREVPVAIKCDMPRESQEAPEVDPSVYLMLKVIEARSYFQLMSMGEVLPICTFPSELSFQVLANILFFDLQLLWCFFHSRVVKSLTGVP